MRESVITDELAAAGQAALQAYARVHARWRRLAVLGMGAAIEVELLRAARLLRERAGPSVEWADVRAFRTRSGSRYACMQGNLLRLGGASGAGRGDTGGTGVLYRSLAPEAAGITLGAPTLWLGVSGPSAGRVLLTTGPVVAVETLVEGNPTLAARPGER